MNPKIQTSPIPITVVIADDHPLVLKGMVAWLQGLPDITLTGQASSPEAIVALCKEQAPQVAVIDLKYQQIEHPELPGSIKRVSPGTAVVLCSAYTSARAVAACFDSGADGFISKDIESMGLPECVRKAAAGEKFLDPHIETIAEQQMGNIRTTSSELLKKIKAWKRSVELEEAQKRLRKLTPRELQIVTVRTNFGKDIAAAAELGIGESDFKNRLLAIRRKLGLTSQQIYQAIQTINAK